MDSIFCEISENPWTSRGAFSKSERLADSQRDIATVLTCQTSISDAQRQEDGLRPIATDLVQGSSTMLQNLDLFIRTFGKLSENYDHISIQNTKLGMSCHTPFTPNKN